MNRTYYLVIERLSELSDSLQKLLFLSLAFMSDARRSVVRLGSTGTVSFFSDLFDVKQLVLAAVVRVVERCFVCRRCCMRDSCRLYDDAIAEVRQRTRQVATAAADNSDDKLQT